MYICMYATVLSAVVTGLDLSSTFNSIDHEILLSRLQCVRHCVYCFCPASLLAFGAHSDGLSSDVSSLNSTVVRRLMRKRFDSPQCLRLLLKVHLEEMMSSPSYSVQEHLFIHLPKRM